MTIAGIEMVRAHAELPRQTDLLPNEVAIRIGCEACANSFAGTAVAVTRTKQAREAIRQELSDFSELTDVPTVVEVSGVRRVFGSQEGDCVSCPLNTEPAYVQEVVAAVGLDKAQVV